MNSEDNKATVVGEVLAFHLHNGATVVARVQTVDEESGFYGVYRPVELMSMRDPNSGKMHIAFTPYLSCDGVFPPIGEMDLDASMCVFIRGVPEPIKNGWQEFVGAVVTPTKSLIVP